MPKSYNRVGKIYNITVMKSVFIIMTILLIVVLASCGNSNKNASKANDNDSTKQITENKTYKELIIGKWKLTNFKIDNNSNASDEIKKRIEESNNALKERPENKSNYITFGSDNTYSTIEKGFSVDSEDKMNFQLNTNEGKTDDNGKIISIIMYNKNGSIYTGKNKPGPFEIVSLTNDELEIKDISAKAQEEKEGKVLLFVYQRVK
jgi:hypothetical protein